jgi:hypothetical protein
MQTRTAPYRFHTHEKSSPSRHPHSEGISRLLAAAVINQGFRELLLTSPSKAIAGGFQGETFGLNRCEQDVILSIQASSLSEFAAQLISIQKGNNPHGSGCWVPVNHASVLLDAE